MVDWGRAWCLAKWTFRWLYSNGSINRRAKGKGTYLVKRRMTWQWVIVVHYVQCITWPSYYTNNTYDNWRLVPLYRDYAIMQSLPSFPFSPLRLPLSFEPTNSAYLTCRIGTVPEEDHTRQWEEKGSHLTSSAFVKRPLSCLTFNACIWELVSALARLSSAPFPISIKAKRKKEV